MIPPNAHAWAYGQLTAAALTADATAFIRNWPWYGKRWIPDVAPVVAMSVRETETLAGVPRDFGLIWATVDLIVLNTAMWNYIIDEKFPTNGRYEYTFGTFAAATLRLQDVVSGSWLTVNFDRAIAPRRDPTVLQARNGRLPNVRFEFHSGVIAAAE